MELLHFGNQMRTVAARISESQNEDHFMNLLGCIRKGPLTVFRIPRFRHCTCFVQGDHNV